MSQHIINQVHKSLLKSGKTVAAAESCTGGLLSNYLTSLSGSSRYFLLGVVAYSNKVKSDLLKIPASLITRKGAVSKDVARILAENIRKISKSDFGIGITGIAGPAGASPNKPIGTVFIAIATKNKNLSQKFKFSGNRINIMKNAALAALKLLLVANDSNARLYRD
ncbi:MAG: CinA family protein [Candidatus Omnitrophota bacterium]